MLPFPDKKPVDVDWLKANFPCMQACPVHTEAGHYVHLIAQGRFEEAYNIARRPNPFASICGRICSAPCEIACRRGALDKPIAIRALKRFVCERFGVESMTMDIGRLRDILGIKIKPNGKFIAIIGSGPAGLSAAHDLALMGYRVTIFEAQDVAGGMLRLGIPEYRLPRELIRMEVNTILSFGVDIKFGKQLGRDFSLKDLHENCYDAIFLAIGAHKSRDLRVEGVDLDGVLKGVDFLLNVNLGYRVDLGERIVVIGGGNVAIDVARTAARQEKPAEQTVTGITEALDIARSAVRFGAKEVHMAFLESRDEMPATDEEIEEALEEGIHLHPSKGPHRILGKDGQVTGIEMVDCVSVFDQEGKFNPRFDANRVTSMEADSIIMAIGQASDLSFLSSDDAIEITSRGTIKINPDTLMTTAPGVFAGGDLAFGPRIAIDAVADGKKVARSIDAFLFGGKEDPEIVSVLVHDTFGFQQIEGFDRIPRQKIPGVPIDRRVGVAQVELGYDEQTARVEASRCLRCWINTEFSGTEPMGSECILCGGCADICPENCIELVSASEIDFENLSGLDNELAAPAGTILDNTLTSPVGTIFIKDETACIRCGLCAKRCPVGCITMESFAVACA